MPKETVNHHGKRHSMPRCFSDFLGALEHLANVEAVGTGRFFRKGKQRKRFYVKIKSYCDTTRTLKITAYNLRWVEDFFIRVPFESRAFVEDYIRHYDPKMIRRNPNYPIGLRMPEPEAVI